MNFPLQKSIWCGLDKYQMSYVNTIAFNVQALLHLPNGVNQILDHLYIGSYEDATDVENLKALGEYVVIIFLICLLNLF